MILITGASSGFGLAAARALAETGHTTYASMRDTGGKVAALVANLSGWAKQRTADLRTVELDVQSDVSVDRAVTHVLAEAGWLDVVVHSAGHMVVGRPRLSRRTSWRSDTTPTCWAPSG